MFFGKIMVQWDVLGLIYELICGTFSYYLLLDVLGKHRCRFRKFLLGSRPDIMHLSLWVPLEIKRIAYCFKGGWVLLLLLS